MDEEVAQAIKNHQARIKENEEKLGKLSGDAVQTISFREYEKLLANDEVREKLLIQLQDKFTHLRSVSLAQLSSAVVRADKDLFVKFRDGQYTLDQLKARIAERKDGIKYVVLDDLKQRLDPKYFKEKP